MGAGCLQHRRSYKLKPAVNGGKWQEVFLTSLSWISQEVIYIHTVFQYGMSESFPQNVAFIYMYINI